MPSDPVAEQLAAYNARDLECFLACYAPDVIVEDGSGARLMEDREAILPSHPHRPVLESVSRARRQFTRKTQRHRA
jgi:hypothetical protein